MPFTDDKTSPENEDAERLAQLAAQEELARKLDEITRLLCRMLVLAELSVSDADVDRQLLQKTLERLKAEVERIADGIDL
ncbi:MAG: hypothetical protein NC319_00650 [Butyricicoccus sp.]|nr:hypothetical protein [Butyricicoccus sp.]